MTMAEVQIPLGLGVEQVRATRGRHDLYLHS